jgi:hypothetical protein
MKAKKPLLLVALTLILLAMALLVPAAAFGKPAPNPPVSWVKVATDYSFPDSDFPGLTDRGATVACVQQLADKSLRGQVVVSSLREYWAIEPSTTPTLFRYTLRTNAFTSPDFWDAQYGPHLAHADFFVANKNNWPADLGGTPDWWADYKGAAVADFVAYIPVSQYPASLPWLVYYRTPFADYDCPSIPLRFMFIDSCRLGRPDVMLNWLFIGDPTTPWMPTVWTVPIQSGFVEVHVGK